MQKIVIEILIEIVIEIVIEIGRCGSTVQKIGKWVELMNIYVAHVCA